MNKHSFLGVGMLLMDEYYEASRWPQEGDKVGVRPLFRVPGGSIANATCVAASLGMPTFFYDVMSDSSTADFLLEDLRQSKVDASLVTRVAGLNDPKCLIIKTMGEKTILGINAPKPAVPLSPAQIALFQDAGTIYLCPHTATILPDRILFLRSLAESGAVVAYDVENACTPEEWELLQNATVLFFNQFGLAANCSAQGKTAEALLATLFSSGVSVIVTTLGKEGCRVYSRDSAFSVAAYDDVTVLDTNGAGDAFNAAFLFALSHGQKLRQCAEFATAAANLCITREGARSGAVPAEEVEAFRTAHATKQH